MNKEDETGRISQLCAAQDTACPDPVRNSGL